MKKVLPIFRQLVGWLKYIRTNVKYFIPLVMVQLMLSACNNTQNIMPLFISEEGKTEYFRIYDEIVKNWKASNNEVYVNTSLGPTHIIRHSDNNKPALLLFHAAGVSAASWYANFDALSTRFQVFAIDTPGDAGKSVLSTTDLTVEAYNKWILELLNYFDLPTANICGHSIGGFIAANFAKLNPDRVDKLILLAPAATFQNFRWYIKIGLMLGGKAGKGPKAEKILRMQAHKGFKPDTSFVNLMEAVREFCNVQMIFPYKMKDDELLKIVVPTLVLIPQEEIIYSPVKAAKRAERLLKNGTVEIIPEAGHTLTMEMSDVINKRIIDFVFLE